MVDCESLAFARIEAAHVVAITERRLGLSVGRTTRPLTKFKSLQLACAANREGKRWQIPTPLGMGDSTWPVTTEMLRQLKEYFSSESNRNDICASIEHLGNQHTADSLANLKADVVDDDRRWYWVKALMLWRKVKFGEQIMSDPDKPAVGSWTAIEDHSVAHGPKQASCFEQTYGYCSKQAADESIPLGKVQNKEFCDYMAKLVKRMPKAERFWTMLSFSTTCVVSDLGARRSDILIYFQMMGGHGGTNKVETYMPGRIEGQEDFAIRNTGALFYRNNAHTRPPCTLKLAGTTIRELLPSAHGGKSYKYPWIFTTSALAFFLSKFRPANEWKVTVCNSIVLPKVRFQLLSYRTADFDRETASKVSASKASASDKAEDGPAARMRARWAQRMAAENVTKLGKALSKVPLGGGGASASGGGGGGKKHLPPVPAPGPACSADSSESSLDSTDSEMSSEVPAEPSDGEMSVGSGQSSSGGASGGGGAAGGGGAPADGHASGGGSDSDSGPGAAPPGCWPMLVAKGKGDCPGGPAGAPGKGGGRVGKAGRRGGRGWKGGTRGEELPQVNVYHHTDSTFLGKLKLDTKENNIWAECYFCGMRNIRRYSKYPFGYRAQGRCVGAQVALLHRPCPKDPVLHQALYSGLEYLERRQCRDYTQSATEDYSLFLGAERERDTDKEPDSEPDDLP